MCAACVCDVCVRRVSLMYMLNLIMNLKWRRLALKHLDVMPTTLEVLTSQSKAMASHILYV